MKTKRTLHIIVNNKVATYLTRDGNIVCGNSDYQIVFAFDPEWDAHEEKVARFIWNNKFVDIIFTGNTVDVPLISKTKLLTVGVYAGDLATTTPAHIECTPSILCEQAESEQEVIIDKDGVLQYRVPSPASAKDGDILEVKDGLYTITSVEKSGFAKYVDNAINDAITKALTSEVDV